MTIEFKSQAMKKQDQLLNSSRTASVSVYDAPTIIAPEDSTVSINTPIFWDIASKETMEAVREIESGNIVRCEDEEDFFRHLKA